MENIDEISNYVKVQLQLPCERIGSWLWVETKDDNSKIALEKIGFSYSKNRNLYYYRIPTQRRYFKRYTMDELRNIYNTEQIVLK